MTGQYVGEANPRTMFVEGPFGSGKTTFAIETLFAWLEAGIRPEKILVLVPQRTLARKYLLALGENRRGPGGDVPIRTLNGLAQDVVNLYWSLIAEEFGFHDPYLPFRFLTIETAQYAMARFVTEAVERGEFDAINVAPEQIARQIVDNLGKAAIMGVNYDTIPTLLTAGWGDDRPRKRVLAYEAAGRVAQAYRAYCLHNRLLDYALQIELFTRLIVKPEVTDRFFGGRTHLIAEHMEEDNSLTHDLVRRWLPSLSGALVTYETDAGYRIFVGADPVGGYELRNACDGTMTFSDSYLTSPEINTLEEEVKLTFREEHPPLPEPENTSAGFTFAYHNYFPQMLDWVAGQINQLVTLDGVNPREIVVLAPYLSDALRFSLTQKLKFYGIDTLSHRPSRALREEPTARTILTLTALAHPRWGYEPPEADVADALQHAIDGLDPIRARLLAKIVYRKGRDPVLTPFESINPDMQARITYLAGGRYDALREWLLETYPLANNNQTAPLDHFFSLLFGEVLSQPGYGFHDSADAGRVTAELVESAWKFRAAIFADSTDYDAMGVEYYNVVEQGLLSALYVSSWRDELKEGVFMAPAYTFLMRNRPVEVQFWLDVGSAGWWERLDQPLTHPYILTKDWPVGEIWTDQHEVYYQQDRLQRLMMGLIRRCRKQVYLGISDLGESGFEQRGPMLNIFQQILRRYPQTERREG